MHLSLTKPLLFGQSRVCAAKHCIGVLERVFPQEWFRKRPVSVLKKEQCSLPAHNAAHQGRRTGTLHKHTHTHMQVDGSYNCGQHLGNSWIIQKESGILCIGNSIKNISSIRQGRCTRPFVTSSVFRTKSSWSILIRSFYGWWVSFLLCIQWHGKLCWSN